MKKTNEYHMNIGGASIILLIIVFALTIFAILSVRASYHEMKLATKTRESVENYYELDSEAEIKKIYVENTFRKAMYMAQDGKIYDLFNTDGYTQEGDLVTYTVEKNGSRLYVTLQLLSDATTVVKEWRLEEKEEGNYGQGSDIWNGDLVEIID